MWTMWTWEQKTNESSQIISAWHENILHNILFKDILFWTKSEEKHSGPYFWSKIIQFSVFSWHFTISLSVNNYLINQNYCMVFNRNASTEARLAPGSCTVEYKQLDMCTWNKKSCSARPKIILSSPKTIQGIKFWMLDEFMLWTNQQR